jgi:hypothetical protein
MLHHTSGLPDYYPFLKPKNGDELIVARDMIGVTNEDVLEGAVDLEPDPKVCCVRHAGVIHGSGINRDGARGCGRRSTAGFIGGKLKGIRAI